MRDAGIETAGLDARVLAGAAFGVSAEQLIGDPAHPVPDARTRLYSDFVARRAQGEPVAYITGRREFWSLDFAVAPGCLIPRPDSESMICALLECVGTRTDGLKVLDLGTGSGCLLLALLKEWPGAWGVGVDRNPCAVQTARENAARLGSAGRAVFVQASWARAMGGAFDVVIANPPYIPTAEIPNLLRDVRDFEPHAALDGGGDGLDAVRAVLAQAPRVLAAKGVLGLEFGPGQAAAVERIGRTAAGLYKQRLVFDLAGRERGILLRRLRD